MTITGEYWIADGYVQFSDSDIGEFGHEGYALDAVQRSIIEKFPHDKYGKFLNSENVDFDTFIKIVIDNEIKDNDTLNKKTISKLLEKIVLSRGLKKDTWRAANGIIDAREYVIKHYGWKAVRGDNVETQNLLMEDMKDIADGLDEILEQEGVDKEEGEKEFFSIYVYSNGKSYDITLDELRSGKIPGISPQVKIGNIALQQSKELDIKKMHPYYGQKTFQFGDCSTFKGWLIKENNLQHDEHGYLTLDDPTRLGLIIKLRLEILPGASKKGVYMGQLCFGTPYRVGGLCTHSSQEPTEDSARMAIKEMLKKRHKVYVPSKMVRKDGNMQLVPIDVNGLSTNIVHYLKPVIFYTGEWAPGYLEKQSGYDPIKHKKDVDSFDKFMGDISKIKKQMADEVDKSRKFGDGPPQQGQHITEKDVKILPDMINTFGDFDVIIVWGMRPRHTIKASDLFKHYNKIIVDAEIKTGDYIRNIYVK